MATETKASWGEVDELRRAVSAIPSRDWDRTRERAEARQALDDYLRANFDELVDELLVEARDTRQGFREALDQLLVAYGAYNRSGNAWRLLREVQPQRFEDPPGASVDPTRTWRRKRRMRLVESFRDAINSLRAVSDEIPLPVPAMLDPELEETGT